MEREKLFKAASLGQHERLYGVLNKVFALMGTCACPQMKSQGITLLIQTGGFECLQLELKSFQYLLGYFMLN